ncbi:MAG: hypothetical protein QOI13_3429 [Paraburkholderia sp.]|jgi:hypothetical protein|nr:hypothetical protein [Paraburkholderia sp.]
MLRRFSFRSNRGVKGGNDPDNEAPGQHDTDWAATPFQFSGYCEAPCAGAAALIDAALPL